MHTPIINVTRPHLPPLEDFLPSLRHIWDGRVLTNSGPYHQQLESELQSYLGVPHISLFCNATIALVTALQALQIQGEVITTPYTFVATSHALLWNNLKPVFVDIEPDTFNIDPEKIERAITPATTAIMPVHVYGRPCNVVAIESIARKHGLRVIYDAAHAFGVRDLASRSVLNAGDLSILSFHATKVFNTFEGGAIISPNLDVKRKLDQLKNFGFVDETTVVEAGINGKMSEFNAALGILQLQHLEAALVQRSFVDQYYRNQLAGVEGVEIPNYSTEFVSNFAYFPILVKQRYVLTRDGLYDKLKESGVFSRRYFYPLVTQFPMYSGLPSASPSNLPVANEIAQQVICLPIYPGLEVAALDRIIALIRGGA